MIKPNSIEIMKESRKKNQLRAYINHKNKMKEKLSLKTFKENNYRNLNTLIFTEETPLHSYAKFIVSLVLKESNNDFLTEYKLKNSKIDVYCPDKNIIIELEHNGKQRKKIDNKLSKYDSLLQLGIIDDIFVIDLKDFSLNLNEDIEFIKNRLGV